ncbi:hypothetical protein CEXT_139761 [Caerostris extrusa]|uniref:Uncharacterized protein n=1 Tax=Caerostris extrusa TaxID=172846 RepID=A0AAV4QI50_CAEEX|nr:hypothetical protein CEXT_139761 [Caerostris extrusa]
MSTSKCYGVPGTITSIAVVSVDTVVVTGSYSGIFNDQHRSRSDVILFRRIPILHTASHDSAYSVFVCGDTEENYHCQLAFVIIIHDQYLM